MKKPEKLPPLSEVQMEIMAAVWDRGEATLGDIWKELSSQRPVARNTVQTLLSRLVDKGWLNFRAEGKIFHYSASVPRRSSLSAVAKRFLNTTFAGSTEGLVMALLDGKELSSEEAERIRKLIAEAEERSKEEGR